MPRVIQVAEVNRSCNCTNCTSYYVQKHTPEFIGSILVVTTSGEKITIRKGVIEVKVGDLLVLTQSKKYRTQLYQIKGDTYETNTNGTAES